MATSFIPLKGAGSGPFYECFVNWNFDQIEITDNQFRPGWSKVCARYLSLKGEMDGGNLKDSEFERNYWRFQEVKNEGNRGILWMRVNQWISTPWAPRTLKKVRIVAEMGRRIFEMTGRLPRFDEISRNTDRKWFDLTTVTTQRHMFCEGKRSPHWLIGTETRTCLKVKHSAFRSNVPTEDVSSKRFPASRTIDR